MPMRRTARCAVRHVWVAKSGGPNTAPEEGVRLPPGIPADTSPAGILRRRRARLSPTRQGPCFRISRPQRPFPAAAVSRVRRLGSSVASGCGAAAATPRTVPDARTSRAPCLRPDALRADAARRPLSRIVLLNRRLPSPRRSATANRREEGTDRRAYASYAPGGRRDGDWRRRRGRRPGAKRAEGREWGGRRGCRQARTQADAGGAKRAPPECAASGPTVAALVGRVGPAAGSPGVGDRHRPPSGRQRAKGARGAGKSAGGMDVALRPRGGVAATSRNPTRGLAREGFETRGRTQRTPSAASRSPRTSSVGPASSPDKVLLHPILMLS